MAEPAAKPPSDDCTIILLAGPSGSGKSRLARLSGLPVLRLDDFYFDADNPGLPRVQGLGSDDAHDALASEGLVDWDDPRTWNADAACRAIAELLRTGRTTTPDYSIAESRAVGVRDLDLEGSRAVIGEGIFAVEAAAACREQGLHVQCWWLDRRPAANFARRLTRDLRQHRKAPPVLLRRGLELWRREHRLRQAALAAGFEPLDADRARRRLETLQSGVPTTG